LGTRCFSTADSGLHGKDARTGDDLDLRVDRELCEDRAEEYGCEWKEDYDANCRPDVCCFGYGDYCAEVPNGEPEYRINGKSSWLSCIECMQLPECEGVQVPVGCCGGEGCQFVDTKSSCAAYAYAGCEWREGEPDACYDDVEVVLRVDEGDRLFKGISEEAEETSAEDMKNLLAAALLLIAAVAMYAMYALCLAKGKKSVRGAADERQPLIL